MDQAKVARVWLRRRFTLHLRHPPLLPRPRKPEQDLSLRPERAAAVRLQAQRGREWKQLTCWHFLPTIAT